MAAQAAGGSEQNEEGSIERTVNSMFKMNLKKAGSDEGPRPVSKPMKTIIILQLMSEAADLALQRHTQAVAQGSKETQCKVVYWALRCVAACLMLVLEVQMCMLHLCVGVRGGVCVNRMWRLFQ